MTEQERRGDDKERKGTSKKTLNKQKENNGFYPCFEEGTQK